MKIKKEYHKREKSEGLRRTTILLEGKIVDQLMKYNMNISAICRDALEKVLEEIKKEKT